MHDALICGMKISYPEKKRDIAHFWLCDSKYNLECIFNKDKMVISHSHGGVSWNHESVNGQKKKHKTSISANKLKI